MSLLNYLRSLRAGKIILWCYLIWYLAIVVRYFDPTPAIWLNSLGISAVIGFALRLSVSAGIQDHWQTFRLFLMPFCVSSFSSLIKGRGFILIVPPTLGEIALAAGSCVLFLVCVLAVKISARS